MPEEHEANRGYEKSRLPVKFMGGLLICFIVREYASRLANNVPLVI